MGSLVCCSERNKNSLLEVKVEECLKQERQIDEWLLRIYDEIYLNLLACNLLVHQIILQDKELGRYYPYMWRNYE